MMQTETSSVSVPKPPARVFPASPDPSVQLAAEYSAKADAYDRLWAPVINPMAAGLFDALDLGSARRILDLGSGTGSHFDELRARAPEASVIGADRSAGMLGLARRNNPAPVVALDARALAFGDQSFDAAILVFMLFHVPDPALALREVRRVLKPGGTIGLVVWGDSAVTPDSAIWKQELDAHGADADPRDPSVGCHHLMNDRDKLDNLLIDAGFTTRRVWAERVQYQWKLPDLMTMQLGCGPAHRRLRSLPGSQQLTCIRAVEKRLERLPEEHLIFRSEVLFAKAGVPRPAP